MPTKSSRELRQFICHYCPGKYSHHKYRVWYARVKSDRPESECNNCRETKEAVRRGEEEGVHVCNFKCSCGHSFVVRCRMQDTAPCYGCHAGEVVPHSFQPLRRIKRCSDNVHKCSRCDGKGRCPNMRRQSGEGGAARQSDWAICLQTPQKELQLQEQWSYEVPLWCCLLMLNYRL